MPNKVNNWFNAGCAAALVLTMLTGCQSMAGKGGVSATAPAAGGMPKVLVPEWSGNDPEKQLAYWHGMSDRRVASNDEVLHGLLLFMDGKDDATDYQGRVSTLKSRGFLDPKFTGQPDEAIRRGDLAQAIVKWLDIRGGVSMTIFGPCALGGRYAVRELVYQGVLPQSSPNQTFSGIEFLGVVGRMEDIQRYDKARKEGTPSAASRPENR